jgi:hypothetical protein
MAVQVGEFLRPSLEALGASMSKLASNQAFISFLKIVGTLIGGALVGGIRVAIQAFSAFINAINWVLAKLKPLYDGISQVFEAVAKATGRPVQPLKTFQNSVISASNTVSLEVPKVSKTFDRGTKSVAKSAESGAKAVDEYAKRIKDAFGTINTLMTPQEAAKQTTQKQLQDLNVLLKNGKITVDEWRKQMARVYEEEDAFIKKSAADRAKGALDRMNTRNEKPEWLSNVGSVKNNPNAGILASTDWIDKWKDGQTKAINDNDQLRDAFANTFSEGLSEALNGNSGNWLKSWWQKTMQNAFQNAANNAGKILFDLLNKSGGSSGSGGGGGIGDWARLAMQFFSKSPGFATGGSFKVGGSGGTDSKYIGMRLTPGEMVNVTKPGNDNGGQIMIPVSLGGEHIETIMVDIATRQATVVTGAALQGVSTAQARQKTYSRFAR